MKTKSAPARGSSPSRSLTSPSKPLKLLRKSQGSSATYTFKPPVKLSTSGHLPNSTAAATRPPAALAPAIRDAYALHQEAPPADRHYGHCLLLPQTLRRAAREPSGPAK